MICRKFSKRQLLAMTWWNRPDLQHHDAIVCHGAVRSGKTLAITCGFFLWSMARFDGGVFALCGKTVGALRRNLLQPLPDWLGSAFRITEHRADNRLTVRLGSRVNTYYLFGGQDESACALIQGVTLSGVLLDEAVLMPRSFVEQACARCSVPGSKLWLSCNPEGADHWLYREWILKAREKRTLVLHFTMEDNPGLDASVKARYHRLYTGVFYRRFVLGQWCQSQGLIYTLQDSNLCAAPPGRGRYYISVDYGTHNPFSAGLWQVTDGVAYRLREFYHCGRQSRQPLTDEDYHRALEELAGDLPVEQVIVDPSAASFIALLRRKGVFRVRRGKNAVVPGIRLVSSLLQAGALRFHPDCKDTLREFSLYRWDEEASQDRPVKEHDHAMDDIRYFCMGVMHRSKETR